MPTDARTAGAVKEYMAEHHMDIPPVYPPAVQDQLAKNMTALDQIGHVLNLLEPYKKETSSFIATIPSLLYKVGYTDPKKDLGEMIGKISVTDITSAGRVLASAGIRTNRINYEDALAHTPDPTKDSGHTMYNKLLWMQQAISDQNKNALTYQRKSGVIPVGNKAATGGKPPTNAQEYLQSIGHQ